MGALNALHGDRISLETVRKVAIGVLELRYSASPSTTAKYVKETTRFFTQLKAQGIEFVDEITYDNVDDYLWSVNQNGHFAHDVCATTASNRQSILRSVLRELETLGISISIDLLGPPIRRNHNKPVRLLTNDELQRIRNCCTGGFLFTATTWLVALSEAGGSASEIASVRGDDIDFEKGVVQFRGKNTRTNPLSEWGHHTLKRVITQQPLKPRQRICCDEKLSDIRAAHTVTASLHKIFRTAGLARTQNVSARSIRHTFARQILDTSGIEAAAKFLGSDSLDATARALFYEWQVK